MVSDKPEDRGGGVEPRGLTDGQVRIDAQRSIDDCADAVPVLAAQYGPGETLAR